MDGFDGPVFDSSALRGARRPVKKAAATFKVCLEIVCNIRVEVMIAIGSGSRVTHCTRITWK